MFSKPKKKKFSNELGGITTPNDKPEQQNCSIINSLWEANMCDDGLLNDSLTFARNYIQTAFERFRY